MISAWVEDSVAAAVDEDYDDDGGGSFTPCNLQHPGY